MIFPDSGYDNEKAVQELPSRIQNQRTLLLVGAGSSVFAGYRDWDGLLSEMQQRFAPATPLVGSPLEDADAIKKCVRRRGEEPDYYRFLRNLFAPRSGRAHHERFHTLLLQLPVWGVLTTNYDLVLESAIGELAKGACEATDLCNPSSRDHHLYEYLRGLAPHGGNDDPLNDVLHLHGRYDYPEGIVLALEDYERHYGKKKIFDAQGRPVDDKLDSLHRKVIWSLLTNYHILFVGFKLKDPFFQEMLQIVRDDLKLGRQDAHTALMGRHSDESLDPTVERLSQLNVKPVFFDVQADAATGRPRDYLTGQLELLESTLTELGVSIRGARDETWSDVNVSRARRAD